MDMQYRALRIWPKQPTPSHKRQRSQFTAKYSDTLQVLERELGQLRATSVIIEADCDASEIRRDGNLRADARLKGPGVVLRFESKHGPQTFPCDTFTDWQDNLRAIALALEALRKVDRYGVTSSGEQYRGFAALPAPKTAAAFQGPDAAALWIGEKLGWGAVSMPPWTEPQKEQVRREAIGVFHPDRNNGDDSLWKLWQDAAAVLGIVL